MAERFAELSHAKRLKVGAIVVKEHRVISIGYNGTPAGWDNSCEKKVYTLTGKYDGLDEDGNSYQLVTKDEVIHAEANAISKLARDGESAKDATMFLTHAPCIHCSKLIYGSGIKQVYYRNAYRDDSGVNFLTNCNVKVNYERTR
jgi:dCMP deaminase